MNGMSLQFDIIAFEKSGYAQTKGLMLFYMFFIILGNLSAGEGLI